jgi:hypothetical protein
MELTTTVDCRCRVSATLEETGELSLKVFGQADYAKGRSTTAEVIDIPPVLRENVKAALHEVLKAAEPALGPRIQRSIHISGTVAAAHGEI